MMANKIVNQIMLQWEENYGHTPIDEDVITNIMTNSASK